MTAKNKPIIPVIRDLEKELWRNKENSSNKHIPVITKNNGEYVLDNEDLDNLIWQDVLFSFCEMNLGGADNFEETVGDKTFIVLNSLDSLTNFYSVISCAMLSTTTNGEICSNSLFYIDNYKNKKYYE